MYKYIVRAWRDSDDTTRLPIACNTEAEARAMFAHVLRAASEFDHADLCERRGSSEYFTRLETGHRAGTVAAGLVANTINRAMIPVVDQCFADVMAANAAEPYSHEEYDRCDHVLRAALVMLTNGDMPYARALRHWFTDSNEDIHTYLTRENRDQCCYNAGEMTREEYEATLQWAVECEEDGDKWTDAFPTREAADEHAALLRANTKVVDRHAPNGS